MPRKLRDLLADLRRAGFRLEPSRGSHRKLVHPSGRFVILSGHKEGVDAHHYQEKQTKRAIADTKK
jgi:predicted RNA binding protein YcfA (HicA-like mRNA interferase family)